MVLSVLSSAESVDRRRELFESLDPLGHFNRLFDHLPGVHFFAKDLDGHILFANVGLARLYGFESEDDFVGRTDFEVLPIRLAEKFRRDDVTVMTSGRPMLGIVELFLNPQGIPGWFLTNKLPLRSRDGRVVGLMGSIQSHRETGELGQPLLNADIDVAVSRLRKNYADNMPIRDLAELCGLSVRQFETKFRAIYNTSPNQFRIRLRVMKACELLRNSTASVSTVAMEVGFYDQSALSYHLKTIMGYTPLQYRKRFG